MKLAQSTFDQLSKVNVLVIGDVMVDRYLIGEVNRISPEAPVPVVQLKETLHRLGGAANVALNLKAMGADPILCSFVGADAAGHIFHDLLVQEGISTKCLLNSRSRCTTIKTRIMAQNQHLLRVDEEQTQDLPADESEVLIQKVKEILDTREVDVILLQDYNKGVLSDRTIREVILQAVKRDIFTVVDPKYYNFWAYKHVTLFKPNLKEIRAQVDFPVSTDLKSLKQTSDWVRTRLSNKYTWITLSEKGLFYEGDGTAVIIPTHPREIADVSGAGDTVIALAALGLGAGIPMRDIAILANLAGGQVCEKPGVVPVNKKQLLMEYSQILEQDS